MSQLLAKRMMIDNDPHVFIRAVRRIYTSSGSRVYSKAYYQNGRTRYHMKRVQVRGLESIDRAYKQYESSASRVCG